MVTNCQFELSFHPDNNQLQLEMHGNASVTRPFLCCWNHLVNAVEKSQNFMKMFIRLDQN